MKVVHLCTIDMGGAYKAAVRISESMQNCGIDSEILLRTKKHENAVGVEYFHNGVQKTISKVKNVGNLLCSKGEIKSEYWGTDVTKHPLVREADVIILHWVTSFISYSFIEKLLHMGKPVIWVMHDMWLFTGGCHCDWYCGGYRTGCGSCALLNKTRKQTLSRKNFLRKQRMLLGSHICILGPSNWIVNCAKKSSITSGQRIEVLPNPIDISLYRPLKSKKNLYHKYKIDSDKKIILYGAMNATGNQNKGYQYLRKAFKQMDTSCCELVVFGNEGEDSEINQVIKTRFIGYVQDERALVELYNLADVFVCPSKQDNYPNSVLEAQACNTPVAAFRVGGIPEIVIHKETGYLCRYGDVDELARGIRYCMEMEHPVIHLRIEKMNGYQEIGERYKRLLESLLG